MINNESIIEYKVKLINKYLNKYYTLDDAIARTIVGEKIEYFYLDEILINSIEKALQLYEPLLILGTTKKIETKINTLKEAISKYKKTKSSEIDNFIKDYEIDIKQIENDVLLIINRYLKY